MNIVSTHEGKMGKAGNVHSKAVFPTPQKKTVTMKPYFVPKIVLSLFLFIIFTGCSVDMDKEEEVREKVRAGQYEEAIALARDHLGDDKRVLLVMLEYIAYEKKKAEKKAYMENVSIEDVRWSTGTSGITEVSGRLVNRGNKIITGIGLYIACVRQGLPGKKKFDRVTLRVSPFSSEEIRGILKGSENCENIEIRIVDLGTEDPPLVRQP